MSLATVARSVAIAVAVLVASISPEAFAGGKGPDGYERWSDDIVDLFDSLPVQENGRLKPAQTFARYKLMRMNGSKRMRMDVDGKELKLSASEWLLDCLFRPELAKQLPVFKVNNPAVMEAIGVKPHGKPRERYSYAEITADPSVMPELKRRVGDMATIIRDADRDEEGKKIKQDPVKSGLLALNNAIDEFDWIVNAFGFASGGLPVDLGEVSSEFEKSGTGKTRISYFLENFDKIIAVARGEGGEDFVEKVREGFRRLEFDMSAAGVKDKRSEVSLAMFPPISRDDEEWVKPGYLIESLSFRADELPLEERQKFAAWALPKIKSLEAMAASADDPDTFLAELKKLHGPIVAEAKARGEYGKIELELFNYKAAFFHWAMAFYLFGFLVLAFTWLAPTSGFAKYAGMGVWGLVGFATLALICGIVYRCIIVGRPPISTLYETILFITAAAVLLCLLIERVDRKKIALACASIIGVGGMFLAMRFEIKEAADTLKVLEAVLRSNFWLATHVICINIGYSAAILAGVIAHVYIFAKLFGSKNKDFLKAVVRMVYGVTCFGLLFSLVGTVLGGVWANDSWGRFWGWDPKENGALMICLGALALLHARMGGFIRDLGVCMAAVFILMITFFSWWHVNELGVGLHSYGFTSGVMFWLTLTYITESIVIGFGVWVFFRDRAAKGGGGKKSPQAPEKIEPSEA